MRRVRSSGERDAKIKLSPKASSRNDSFLWCLWVVWKDEFLCQVQGRGINLGSFLGTMKFNLHFAIGGSMSIVMTLAAPFLRVLLIAVVLWRVPSIVLSMNKRVSVLVSYLWKMVELKYVGAETASLFSSYRKHSILALLFFVATTATECHIYESVTLTAALAALNSLISDVS